MISICISADVKFTRLLLRRVLWKGAEMEAQEWCFVQRKTEITVQTNSPDLKGEKR